MAHACAAVSEALRCLQSSILRGAHAEILTLVRPSAPALHSTYSLSQSIEYDVHLTKS